MNELDNPFVEFGYAGPAYFCDREQETKNLIEALRNGSNVTLMSPRRLGKTGLIQHAFYQIGQQNTNIACFYVDIYATYSFSDFVSALARVIVGKLDTPAQKAEGFIAKFFHNCQLTMSVDQLTGMPQMGLSFKPSETQQTLEQIFAYIAQSGRTCYIAIDEFQQIAAYEEKNMEALLRTYVQANPNIRFIFSGSKQHMMTEMFASPKHPFYCSTECQTLYPINEQVYYQFVKEKLDKKNITLSEDIFHKLYALVDGVTWFIQVVLNRLYRLEPCTITEEILYTCIEKIILSNEEYYKRQCQVLTRNQTVLLRAIAQERCVKEPLSGRFIHDHNLKSASSIQRAFQYLLEEEFVGKTDAGYIINDRFLAMWLKQI